MVAKWKIEYVQNLKEKLNNSAIFGISNVMDIPASSLQRIRKSLREKGFELKVVKKKLLIKALEDLVKTDRNYEKIIDILEKNKRITIMLLIPPREYANPFIINKILEENKSYREARPGDVLEEDIVVRAGPTNFQAGPILSEFKKFNIKTKVEGGKIVIVEDAVIAKKGDVVSNELADFLKKLNITPIPVKVKLLLVYDKKTLYTEDVLSIPLEKYLEDLKAAFKKAFAVSIHIGYPTKENIGILIRKSIENAYKLSIKTGIPTRYTIKDLIIRAVRIGNYIKDKLNI